MEPENTENEPPANQVKFETTNGAHTEVNGKGFRVRNVSEINASSLHETDENSNKRKFSAPTVETESENECTKAKKANNNDEICLATRVKIEENDTEQLHELKVDNLESVQIQTEIISSNNVEIAQSEQAARVEVKAEPVDSIATNDEPSCSNGNASSSETKVKVEKASSTTRESCRFGIRCFRHTANHRQEEAHPGDADYRRPSFPAPSPGTPQCPYGSSCYRRNPSHFSDFAHPENNLYIPNIPRNLVQIQNLIHRLEDDIAEDDDTSDFEEPFSDDSGDYVPTDDESYTDDLSGDYDDCDRVEE